MMTPSERCAKYTDTEIGAEPFIILCIDMNALHSAADGAIEGLHVKC